MALQASRLAIEIDSRSAEQKVNDMRTALQALELIGLRIKPSLSDAMNGVGPGADAASKKIAALEAQVRSLAAASGAAAPSLSSAMAGAGSGASAASSKIAALEAQVRSLAAAASGVNGSIISPSSITDLNAAIAKLGELRKAMSDLSAASVNAGPNINAAAAATARVGASAEASAANVTVLGSELRSLGSIAMGLAAPLLAALSIGEVYKATEAYSTLTNRLKLVTDGATELAAAQKAVFGIAQDARQPLEATAELYQRISTNQTAMRLSGEGVAGIVGTISKTMAISGAAAASANAALVQLGQAFSSGVLRGEELNSVLEQAPALAQAIARGMNVTVGELKGLGAQGKLTGDQVVKALQAQKGAVDELFARMAPTIGGSLTVIGNSFTNLIGQIDQATGQSAKFANSILDISKSIDNGLPGTLKFMTDNANALSQAMTTTLYVAIARVAGGFGQQAAQAGYAFAANQSLLKSTAEVAAANLTAAETENILARADLVRANADVATAESAVAASRTRQAAELANIQTVEATLAAELALEQARLRAQITEQGRAASITRMAEIRLSQVAIIGQVAEAERALAATTLATSAQVEASYAARTAAAAAYAETTLAVNALTTASNEAAAAASLTSRALGALSAAGSGLLSMLGGPVGLLFITGAVAVSFMDFRSSSDKAAEGLKNMEGPLDSVIAKFKQLTQDQKAAALVKWGEAQAESVKAASSSMTDLKDELKALLVDGSPESIKKYWDISGQLDAAASSGKQLAPVLEQVRSSAGIDPGAFGTVVKLAGAYSTAATTSSDAAERIKVLTAAANDSTDSSKKNADATDGMTAAGKTHLAALQKTLAGLQDNHDAVKQANRYIADHTELTNADKVAILSTANAMNAQTQANKDATKAARDAKKTYKDDASEKLLLTEQQRYAVLLAQSKLIGVQGEDATKLNTDAQKLVAFEQQIADLKEKKTLTAAQKQVLAGSEALLNQLKLNAAQSTKNDLDKASEIEKGKLLAYQQNLTAELQKSQEALDNLVLGYGMGDEAAKRLQETTKIQAEYQAKLNKLTEDYNKSTKDAISTDQYDKETAQVKAALAQRLQMQEDYYTHVDQMRSDWSNGATKSYQNYLDSAKDIAGQTKTVFDDAFKGMEDALTSFVSGGKLSFKSLADSIIADLSRILAKTYIVAPLLGALGIGSSGTANAASLASGGSSSGSLMGMVHNASTAFSLATSGFGQAISAGWASGDGLIGGLQSAFSGGAEYVGSAITSAFSGGSAVAGTAIETAATTGAEAIGSQFAMSAGASASFPGAAAATATTTGSSLLSSLASYAGPAALAVAAFSAFKAYQDGLRLDASSTRGNAMAWATGFQPIAELNGAIGKLTKALGIGGTLGNILNIPGTVTAMIGSALFGGGWVTKDVGLSLSATNGALSAQSYEDQKKKGGLFGSNKKRTNYSALDTDTNSTLQDAFAQAEQSVASVVAQIGVPISAGMFDGLKIAESKLSTDGKTATEIQAMVANWFSTTASDEMVKYLDQGTGGFGYDFATLKTMVANFASLNTALGLLNITTLDLSSNSMVMANNFLTAAGGLDAFSKKMDAYYKAFFTTAQQNTDTLSTVNKQFQSLGLTLPVARDGFRAMVEAIDFTTASGQSMFSTLMSLADSANSAYMVMESNNAAYNSAFLSTTEQNAVTLAAVTDEFKKANATLPATRDGFKAMVEAIDTTTTSGLLASQALKGLSADADSYYKILEAKQAAALSTALSGATNAQTALKNSIAAQQQAATDAYNATTTSLNDMVATVNTNISGLTSVGNSLDNALKSLRGTSSAAVTMLRAQADATLQSALATAKAGGSLANFPGLSDALTTVSNNSTDLYATLADYQRAQGRTTAVVTQLNDLNGKQLTTEQKTLATLQAQLATTKKAYDAQNSQYTADLSFAQAQIDALNGVDSSVKSVVDAIHAMNASVVAALGSLPKGAAQANTPQNNANVIDTIYQSVLGRGTKGDEAGAAFWASQLQSGALGYDQIAKAIAQGAVGNSAESAATKASAGKYLGIPGYASGGNFAGGIRLVGENGPEIEVTGPSKIISNSELMRRMNGGGDSTTAAMNALAARLDVIAANTQATALQSSKTARMLYRVTQGGDAMQTTPAVTA